MGLVYLTNALQSLMGNVATLTRFHPQIQGLFRFYKDATDDRDEPPGLAGHGPIELIADRAITGSAAAAALSPGDVIWLTTPHDPARSNLAAFLHPIMTASGTSATRWQRAGFLGTRQNFEGEDLDRLLELWHDAIHERPDIAGLVRVLDHKFMLHDPENGTLHKILPDLWPDLSRPSRNLVALIAALHNDTEFLFVSEMAVSRLGHGFFTRLMMAFEDRTLIIVAKADAEKPRVAKLFAVADEETIIGLGNCDWFIEQNDEIVKRLASVSVPQADLDRFDESIFM